MKKILFPELLDTVSSHILKAKNRIYATHYFGNTEDVVLPEKYMQALKKSTCPNKKRICFGNKQLYEHFLSLDTYYKNSYSQGHYNRMLLIDDILFFQSNNSFYITQDSGIIGVFLCYFLAEGQKDFFSPKTS